MAWIFVGLLIVVVVVVVVVVHPYHPLHHDSEEQRHLPFSHPLPPKARTQPKASLRNSWFCASRAHLPLAIRRNDFVDFQLLATRGVCPVLVVVVVVGAVRNRSLHSQDAGTRI